MKLANLPRYMNYKQALKYLNIGSYNTLYKWISKGLPVIEVDGTKRIDKKDADAWLDSKKTNTPTKIKKGFGYENH